MPKDKKKPTPAQAEKQWMREYQPLLQKAERMLTKLSKEIPDFKLQLSLQSVVLKRAVSRKKDGCEDRDYQYRFLLADIRPRSVKIVLAGSGPLTSGFSKAAAQKLKKIVTKKGAQAFVR